MTPAEISMPPITLHRAPAAPDQATALRDAARDLEATFLAEMLKSAGLDGMSGSFSGGAGEQQFASFLREAQAEEIAAAGGIGLSEAIFELLVERQDGR